MKDMINRILYVIMMLSIIIFSFVSLLNGIFAIKLLLEYGSIYMILTNIISLLIIPCCYIVLKFYN